MLGACENKQKARISESNTDTTHKKPQNLLLQKYNTKLKILFQSDEGIIRSISLKTDFNSIQSLIEKNDSSVTFTTINEEKKQLLNCKVVFNIYEDADISFISQDKTSIIKEINIATYLNSQAASDSLKSEITSYFTEKYGKFIFRESKKIKWKNDSLKIDLEDVGVPEAPGLQIKFTRP